MLEAEAEPVFLAKGNGSLELWENVLLHDVQRRVVHRLIRYGMDVDVRTGERGDRGQIRAEGVKRRWAGRPLPGAIDRHNDLHHRDEARRAEGSGDSGKGIAESCRVKAGHGAAKLERAEAMRVRECDLLSGRTPIMGE